jgi:hypothetical protein
LARLGANWMVSPACAAAIAARSEPAPLSAALVTVIKFGISNPFSGNNSKHHSGIHEFSG